MAAVSIHARDPEHRVDTPCHACQTLDQAPRHITLGVDENGAPQVTRRHMDCCRDAGCPDGSCHRILTASGEKRNDELVAYVRSLAPGEHVEVTQ